MVARAFGLGGTATYAVLRGTSAALRLTDTQPSFVLAVPNNAQPQSYFTLAKFEVRKNGTREVSIGGGYMSYSSGIPKDRIIDVKCEQADLGGAPSGFTLYKITPTSPLPNGEYAMVVHSATVHVAGIFTGTGTADSFFDFGLGD